MAHEAIADFGAIDLAPRVLGTSPRPVRSGTVADIVAFRSPEAPRTVRPALSPREVEVLLAWLAADSKEEAAARLFISVSTVSTHVSRIRSKYAGVGRPAPTKAHLLARALQDGHTTLAEW
ncbi:MAG: helix-turn-helix transcriptional regulator [Gordonia sp. (in: high G+C Gram-positive bacteria)]|uniref:response regulator transcription factor n=1 Tax=Gordonia sp. (in: high G+C Gram-positive bacteria) TaxID=84139 RepID=UPI003BB4970B